MATAIIFLFFLGFSILCSATRATTTVISVLVETYAINEPEILKRDFHNSLCAAFEIEEIEKQLKQENLNNLSAERVSDRHVLIRSNPT